VTTASYPESGRPVDAAARLLGRTPPAEYLDAWRTALETRMDAEDRGQRFSVGVFRLGEELFALPTEAVVEVHPRAAVRSVPGRSGDVFRGLVSLRGEIHLCASLHALFHIEDASIQEGTPQDGRGPGAQRDGEDERRLLVVQQDGQTWALLVDAVLDFERFEAADLKMAQVTVAKSAVHFTDGVVTTPRGPAARIDAKRLFEGLARSLQ